MIKPLGIPVVNRSNECSVTNLLMIKVTLLNWRAHYKQIGHAYGHVDAYSQTSSYFWKNDD